LLRRGKRHNSNIHDINLAFSKNKNGSFGILTVCKYKLKFCDVELRVTFFSYHSLTLGQQISTQLINNFLVVLELRKN
jgi:hypothetical protein